MRTLNRNKQTLHYANQIGVTPKYQVDENGNKISYTDKDGNVYYIETGEYEPLYGPIYEFDGNISFSGGESKIAEYGIDKTDYDAVLIMDKNAISASETSRIWHENEIGYIDSTCENADAKTADYRVVKRIPSLNQTKYLLKKNLG